MTAVPRPANGPVSAAHFGERSAGALARQTGVLAGRIISRWVRDPATLAETVLVPVAFLVTLNVVLGDGISEITGTSALVGSVPLVALVAATQGATVGGLGLMAERDGGFLARLWVTSIHRAAGITSRLFAEALRIVAATAVLTITGVLLGLRFENGPAALAAWLLVPAVFGVAFATAVLTVAVYAAKTIVVEATALVSGLFMFFCTGFVPLEQYPRWLQPLVQHQPFSNTVDAMRGLAVGGPVAAPLLELIAWSAGIIAVCAVPLATGYRRASTRD
ncbi:MULTISPECIES: ABC transporter permease [Tsukamurella]|uniref:Peptide ABC transporter permease n=2 Tax=Tsukamurella TaxID=2060 RepID=A0A5C5S8H9_9ACTN|nr:MULTISPECIES: ABC transporter permease [Tsukamurella]NMD58154.1 ABC transporter permease [Tsukamurella columbiensis]TWS30775.1 peptide ABC transporter permease [Tsukamurella conjunctivitidis]